MPLALRLAQASDGPALAALFAPYVRDTAITFQENAPGAAAFSAKVTELLPSFPFLVVEEEGRVLAYAYASPHRALPAYRWCAEVSVYAHLEARAKGAGSRLYTALHAILERQGYVNLYAGITLPNEASVRLHEKFGYRPFARFEKVGFKRGAWHDVGWWEKRFDSNMRTPAAEPRPFAALREKESAWLSGILAP